MDPSGNIKVLAKSKNLRALTVSRLELRAALILSELYNQIILYLDTTSNYVYFWCDATIVLCWIKTSPHLLQTCGANRVLQIQELTNMNHWHYIKTKQNPSDLSTRGSYPGPPWFTQHEDTWPIENPTYLGSIPESKSCHLSMPAIPAEIVIDFSRFSPSNRIRSHGILPEIYL
ncbi:hypothetical protein JTB14_025152 [Gonioctena quinquepunctata]|nr:hypothetical protein JTB14_025152 [Gonioctena quinquepunctata]